MNHRVITLSEPVRQKVAALGPAGSEWLSSLPNLITNLEQEWHISVETSLTGGSEAYVAQAKTRDGTNVILKIAMPALDGNTIVANEITALTLANGQGYAQLLQFDITRRAMLLESLGTSLKNLNYSTTTQINIICSILQASWTHIPPSSSLPSGALIAQELAKFITHLWETLHHPCSQQALHTALTFTQTRAQAFNPNTAVLVHGDAHNNNLLQTLDDHQHSFKFIDPDGIIAEPAYDLGVLMREWPHELIDDPITLSRQRCAYLSQLTGIDAQAVWQWGFIQTMSTGLFLLQLGQHQLGQTMLSIAEELKNPA